MMSILIAILINPLVVLPSGLDDISCCFRSFEVLGQVLNSLEACRQTVLCDGEEFTGPEYRSHLINKICSIRYPLR